MFVARQIAARLGGADDRVVSLLIAVGIVVIATVLYIKRGQARVYGKAAPLLRSESPARLSTE